MSFESSSQHEHSMGSRVKLSSSEYFGFDGAPVSSLRNNTCLDIDRYVRRNAVPEPDIQPARKRLLAENVIQAAYHGSVEQSCDDTAMCNTLIALISAINCCSAVCTISPLIKFQSQALQAIRSTGETCEMERTFSSVRSLFSVVCNLSGLFHNGSIHLLIIAHRCNVQ